MDPLDARTPAGAEASIVVAVAADDTEQAEAADRLPAGQCPGDAVTRDLFDEVGTECHRLTVRADHVVRFAARATARMITSSSIASVNLPVNVFCWLGW